MIDKKYKRILIELMDLYNEIKAQPHSSNPFISYYSHLDKEIIDLFIKWYRGDKDRAVDKAMDLFIDETDLAPELADISYNDGWNVTLENGCVTKTYNVKG